jgi:Smg-4/UPF3 family
MYVCYLLNRSISHSLFVSCSANKENVPSRAYIAFKAKEQLALFSHEYDGHVFRDKTGAILLLFLDG